MINPLAIVSEDVQVPATAQIWHGANIMAGTKLGAFVSIGAYTEIGRYCQIGDRTRIGYGCFIPNRTRIGPGVFIGPHVTMCDDKRPEVCNDGYQAQPPIIEADASIGAGVVILPNVTIGRGAIIGAGAVVTKDVVPYSTVVGCPAAPITRR